MELAFKYFIRLTTFPFYCIYCLGVFSHNVLDAFADMLEWAWD